MVPVMLEMAQTHDREEMAYVQGAGRRVESGIDVEGPRSERLLGTIGEILKKPATAKLLDEGGCGHRKQPFG
jgi:hypothetical protein